jgi:hypothetical protein
MQRLEEESSASVGDRTPVVQSESDTYWLSYPSSWSFKIAYKFLVGKPEGKRRLRRPRCRWDDNFKVNLCEIRLEDVGWICLTHDKDQ